ncbi:MAG: HU family DNA-binding protein [Bacteroidaceae bacterium]|jgi:DNA-binding protein HU-beta|nr:HU family DNA-binding protein [Bacteroidales bacterium]MBR4293651.1 HU family DNA-binding protein [Bacteroidaceae bacterium]MBR6805500.1 HU family DNA-binding protein [Bacteroidaceae bacterium]
MNNKEFISALAKKTGVTVADATANVETLLSTIIARLKDNDQLNISGFGVFEVKMRKEKVLVNPKSGERMLIPPKLVPAFRPSSKLKDKFK